MAVVCAACKTENRDSAMFCRGCTAKLPAFVATGPATLSSTHPAPLAGAARHPQAPEPPYWIYLSLLIVGMALAFVCWYVLVTREPVSSPRAQAAAVPPATAKPSPGTPLALLQRVPPLEPTEIVASPAPQQQAEHEQEQEQVSVAPAATPSRAPVENPVRVKRAAAPAATMVAQNSGAADPRRACGNLNFVAAARCEAAQCDLPGFSRHPRCDVVRADRRRDEERRNPLLAN
ncbi:MAG: hypothetical protein ABWZ88_17800 [Variovorax sp.]